MRICTACWTANRDTGSRCERCSASLMAMTEAQNAENIRRWRERRRIRSHIITGVILCFGLPTLFGLPGSLLPTEILWNLAFAVVFGVPLGYCVSRFAESMLGGAVVGACIGIVYCAISMLLAGGPVTLGAILLGIGMGVIPGAIMGLHVSLDR